MDMNGNQNSVVTTSQGVDMSTVGLTGNAVPVKKNNNTLYLVLGIAAIVLAIVLFAFKGPEEVLNKYGESLMNYDAKKLIEVIHPNVIEMLQDEIDDLDDEDLEYDTVEGLFDAYLDEADDEDIEFKSFEFDKDDFDEIKDDDLEDIADYLNDEFDIKKEDVKAARRYEVEIKVDYDGETDKEEFEFLVIKVGSDWYIFEDEFLIDEFMEILGVSEIDKNYSKDSFALYVEKVVTAVQTQYMYDANSGDIAGSGYYVYDIEYDLNLTTTDDYSGYVIADASDVDDVQYIVSIYNYSYQLLNYNVTLYGLPDGDSKEIEEYDSDDVDLNASSQEAACEAIVPSWEYCYNRRGYLVYSGYYS